MKLKPQGYINFIQFHNMKLTFRNNQQVKYKTST